MEKSTMNWLQQVYIVFARSRAPLYHFTSLQNAINILKSNVLKKGSLHKSISFTRNKNLGWPKDELIIQIRFEIDQNKLRQNYKIKPFQFFEDDRKYNRSSDEERVYTDIKNFSKILAKISVFTPKGFNKHDYNKYLDEFKDRIKYDPNFDIKFLINHPKIDQKSKKFLRKSMDATTNSMEYAPLDDIGNY